MQAIAADLADCPRPCGPHWTTLAVYIFLFGRLLFGDYGALRRSFSSASIQT